MAILLIFDISDLSLVVMLKTIPVQVWTGHEGSRKLILPDIITSTSRL
jgi:hypothetical protein